MDVTKMTSAALENEENNYPLNRRVKQKRLNLEKFAEVIYNYFIRIVQTWSPDLVSIEFKRLFILGVDKANSKVVEALYEIIFGNDEALFRNVINRCSYILLNNWQIARNHKAIQDFIQVFDDKIISTTTTSLTLKRLRDWIHNFCNSQDYQELKLFASMYKYDGHIHWSQRYSSYLLADQYVDVKKPREQREAARALSQQLKERFKFDLAMYTARSQSAVIKDPTLKNPTSLGDEVLRLIKTIVAKRGVFSYVNLANIFLSQTEEVTYKTFKKALQKYLIFSLDNQGFVELINKKMSEKLENLYKTSNEELISKELIRRTCNKVIEYLTTENYREPSLLFILLLSQGNPLTLVMVMLKIVLICPPSYTHLEVCLGKLIRYYDDHPESNCQWLIKFLEIFKITFAIQAENVEYNVLKLEDNGLNEPGDSEPENYRLFSQVKWRSLVEDPDEISDEYADFTSS